MGIYALPLRACHKNGPPRSSATTAAIFTTTALTENESAPFRRKGHLFSISLEATAHKGILSVRTSWFGDRKKGQACGFFVGLSYEILST
jgi:hypothetical protein